MKAVVTGANGYLGSHLVRRLLQSGRTVSAVIHHSDDHLSSVMRTHREQLTIYRHDDLDDAVEDSKEIYHLAGYFSTKDDPETVANLMLSNLLFTTELYAAVERSAPDAHVVCASTFSQLDKRGHVAPDSYYSGMKALAEFGNSSINDRLSFLRLSDTFGPNDWRPKVHNILARELKDKRHFAFRSPAKTELVLTHVDDVASAFIHMCELRESMTCNLLYPENAVTLREVANIFTDELGGSVEFPEEDTESAIPIGVDLIPNWSPSRDPLRTLLDVLEG